MAYIGLNRLSLTDCPENKFAEFWRSCSASCALNSTTGCSTLHVDKFIADCVSGVGRPCGILETPTGGGGRDGGGSDGGGGEVVGTVLPEAGCATLRVDLRLPGGAFGDGAFGAFVGG